MSKRINLEQIESGDVGKLDLAERLVDVGSRLGTLETANTNITETVQDTIGTMTSDSNSVDITYDDEAGTLKADLKLDGDSLAIGTGGTKVSKVDADTVTVSNIEVDNFKTGVLDTDLSTVSEADDTLPSSKAVKSLVSEVETDLLVDIAIENENIMTQASAPIGVPAMNTVLNYTVLIGDITEAQPTTLTIPSSKSYLVGKGNLAVYLNGVYVYTTDYTEASSTTVQFIAGALKTDDIVTYIIGTSAKIDYDVAIAYVAAGNGLGKVSTMTYSGDVTRTVTYTYDVNDRIVTEAIAEGGVVTTKTYTYTDGKLTGISTTIV